MGGWVVFLNVVLRFLHYLWHQNGQHSQELVNMGVIGNKLIVILLFLLLLFFTHLYKGMK